MKITAEQVIAARKLLGWSRSDLAMAAGVSETVIIRFEGRTRVPWGAHAAAIKRVLESAGVEFMSDAGVRPALKESSQRAMIVSEDNGSSSLKMTFPSFREALRYYITVLTPEERDISRIVTANGKEWRRSDLLALYRYGR